MSKSKSTIIGFIIFLFGVILLVISFSSMGPPYSIPKSSMVMSSVGFGTLFLIVGLAIFVFSAINTKKSKT